MNPTATTSGLRLQATVRAPARWPALAVWGTAAFLAPATAVYLGRMQLSDMVLVVAVIFASQWSRVAEVRVPRLALVGVALLVLAASCAMLLPIGQDYLQSREVLAGFRLGAGGASDATRLPQWLFAMVAFPIAFQSAVRSEPHLLVVASCGWIAGAATSALVALLDALRVTRISATLLQFENVSGRQAGLATEPNTLALACLMATCVLLFVQLPRLLTGSVLVLFGTAELLSGSRACQLAFAAVIIGAALRHVRRSPTPLVFLLVGAGVLVPLLATAFPDFIRFGDDSSTAGESDSGRALLAGQAVRDLAQSPVWGIGLAHLTEAHSLYLQIAASVGLIGLAGFLAYVTGILTASPASGRSPLQQGSGLSILAWLVTGSVENAITDRFLYWPVALLLAGVAVSRGHRR